MQPLFATVGKNALSWADKVGGGGGGGGERAAPLFSLRFFNCNQPSFVWLRMRSRRNFFRPPLSEFSGSAVPALVTTQTAVAKKTWREECWCYKIAFPSALKSKADILCRFLYSRDNNNLSSSNQGFKTGESEA